MPDQTWIEPVLRADDKWDWHLKAANGDVICTSGSQGFRDLTDVERSVDAVRRAFLRRPDIRLPESE